jgi:signal transduction histidine kinase
MDAIGTIASGVAHDFNNLLMVISSYAELGLQTLYCDHPLRRNLQEILSASQRGADLTRQLLGSGRGQMPGPAFGEPELNCGRHFPVASKCDWGGRRIVPFIGERRRVH